MSKLETAEEVADYISDVMVENEIHPGQTINTLMNAIKDVEDEDDDPDDPEIDEDDNEFDDD